MYTVEDKAQQWATVLLTVSGSAVLIATTVCVAKHAAAITALNGAEVVHKLADAHRLASLAKTYDAKAAGIAIRTLAEGFTQLNT